MTPLQPHIIIMTHALLTFILMFSPLQIGGDIIYVLICVMTDPEATSQLQKACLVNLSIWMTAKALGLCM